MPAQPKRRGPGIRPRRIRRSWWVDPADPVLLGQVAALRRVTASDVIREAIKAYCTAEIAAMGSEMARALPVQSPAPDPDDH